MDTRTGRFRKASATTWRSLPELTAWIVTLLELVGGLALIVGVFVTLLSILLIVSMFVAMFTVHFRYGFSAIKTIGLTKDGPVFGPPGYEVNLLYIAGLLVLILAGPVPSRSTDGVSVGGNSFRKPAENSLGFGVNFCAALQEFFPFFLHS